MTEEQDKAMEEELSEVEISNLPDKEFKVMIIEMLKEFGRRTDEKSKVSNNKLENMKKNQTEMKNTITEIKITLEVVNSRLIIQRNRSAGWKAE